MFIVMLHVSLRSFCCSITGSTLTLNLHCLFLLLSNGCLHGCQKILRASEQRNECEWNAFNLLKPSNFLYLRSRYEVLTRNNPHLETNSSRKLLPKYIFTFTDLTVEPLRIRYLMDKIHAWSGILSYFNSPSAFWQLKNGKILLFLHYKMGNVPSLWQVKVIHLYISLVTNRTL